MRDPKTIASGQQLEMLDWFSRQMDNREYTPELVTIWRRRIRQVGVLPDPQLENMRQEIEKILVDIDIGDDPTLVRLADTVYELVMMADPESDDGYTGPTTRMLDGAWPLDPIEDMHYEMNEKKEEAE